MDPVWSRIAETVAGQGAAALVSVAAVAGSAPREPGARMVVRPDGGFWGTIGGGALEWAALADARAALARGRGPALLCDRPLGPDLGQCCGGRVVTLVETFVAADSADIARLAALEAAGPFEVEAVLGGDGRVTRRALGAGSGASTRPVPFASGGWADRRAGGDPSSPGTGDGVEQPAPVPGPSLAMGGTGAGWRGASSGRLGDRLFPLRERFGDDRAAVLLFGAGHVGRALALALAPLPFRLRWVDPRADAFPAHVPANAAPVAAADPVAEVAAAAPGTAVLVMTHSHPLDLALVEAALRRDDLPEVGLIGSATKRARFLGRLRAAGLPAAALARLACPIGVPGIGGREPAVIAAAVAAQLLQWRSGEAARRGLRGAGLHRAGGHR